jgi:branched-chain amino acid transport system ATP-binding protein
VALLGSNGAGKTTLFRTIAGVLKPRIRFDRAFDGVRSSQTAGAQDRRMGLVLCPQGRQLFPGAVRTKNLMLGAFPLRGDKKRIQKNLEQGLRFFPFCASASTRRPAPSAAGSSRCWPSPAP